MKEFGYKKRTIGKYFSVKNLCKVSITLLTFFGLITMIKSNTDVYAGTATTFNWNNNQFLTGGFWSQNPTDDQIINALFGANSAYTMNRPSQNCNTGNITVSRISATTLDNNLTENKIYVLQSSGVTISAAITIPKCTAIVSSVNGGTTIYSNGQLTDHMFKIQGSQLRNIIIDNINFEGQYSKAGAHHAANTNCIYIYGNAENINTLANVTINNSILSRCTNGVNIDGNGLIGDTQYITLNNLKLINNPHPITITHGKNILINNTIGKKMGSNSFIDITESNYITINNTNSIVETNKDISIDNISTGIVLNNVVGNIRTETNGCLAHNIYGNITSQNSTTCKIAGYHRYFSQDSCVIQATSILSAGSNIWNQAGVESEEGCVNWNYMIIPERNGTEPLYLFTSPLTYITTNCNGQSVSCRKLKAQENYDAVSSQYKFSFGANVPTQEIVARWNGTTLTKATNFPINTSNYIGSDVKKVNHSTTLPQYVTGSTSFSATSPDSLVNKYSVLGPWITTQRYGINKGTNTTVTWSGGDGEKAVLIQLTGANYFATHFIAETEKTSGGPSFTAGTLLINECSTTSQWQAFKNYNTTNPSSLPFKTSTITGYTDWFHNNGYVSYTAGQPRTISETLTARDSAGNESTRTATITINNVAPTANNFTVSVGGCGPITKNRKTESSATEGNCGNGALTATIVQQGTKGTCTINGNNIVYTANQGANGSDNCSVRITDNEGSYKEITVYWTNISCGNINGLTGTLIIENGAEATNHNPVSLNITRGSSEISKMRFSCNNSTWSNWENFNTTKSWTFSSSYGCNTTQGNKTLYVMFSGNNKTGLASDSIIYDTTKPTVSVSLNSAGGTIQISDSLAGLSGNQLIYYKWQTGTTCPTSISNYSPLSISYQHGDTLASRTISASGLSGNYYLCIYSGFYDRAGNSSDLTRSSNSQSYHSSNGDCYISTQPTLTPIGPNNKTQTGIFSVVCLYPLSASKIICNANQITGRQNYFCGGGQNRNCQSEFESCLSSCNEGDKPCELACKEAFALCEESSTQTTDCNLFNVGCNGAVGQSSQIELTYYYKINPNRLNDITSISYGLNFPLTLRNNVLWNNTPTSDLDTNPIKFDFIGPVTMIISPNNGSTQSGDFVVNMTNTDNRDMDGNISTCYYNIKSGNTIVGSGHGTDVCNTGFIVSIDQCNSSTCTVEARGVDDLGNTGNIATYTYNISFGTPVLSTPEIYNGRHIDVDGTEYYKGSIRVKSYITQGRNISSCQFSTDNGSHRSAGTLSTDEIGQFCYKELNTTNNINIKFRAYNGSYGTSSMLPAIYDNVVPTLSEKTEFNGWYTSSQRSYFYFTDTGVGISGENSEYCTISSEGENQTCSISHINIQDRLGNIVNYQNTSNGANIDYSAPTVTATRNNRACTNNVNITLNATDAISGLPAQPYYFEGSRIGNNTFSINTPGTYNRTIRDIAGNETSYSTGISNIDSIAPVIQITNGIGYECETITGNISATDEGCGNSSITYSWNNSDFGSNTQYGLYSQEASIEGIDTYIPVSAKDGAGNISSDSVQFIWQDRAISGNPILDIGTIKTATGITNIITKFNITGYGSCETITMTTGSCTNATQSWNGTTLTITPSENTSANGSCTVYFTDGDTTLTGTITFTVNTMKPVISITGPASGWAQSKTVKATATNSPTTFKYAITNNSTCNSSISFTNTYTAGSNIDFLSESDNGKYVCFMATNAAGTTYKSSNQITQIDTTKPVCGSPTYTPNSYTNGSVLASIPATDTGAGLEIPSPQTINFTTNGEQNVTYTDNAGNSQTCTASVSRIDKTNPTSTLTSSSTLKVTSQRLTGTCSDTNGIVAYYLGTSTTPSYINITSTASFTTGKNITSAGTYYLYCKDAAGNISSGSKVFYTYTVYNMQETCAGSTTSYNTSNYTTTSSGIYIAPSGTTLTLASIYTAPTGTTFKGINAAAPSSSTATLSNTAPTLSTNSTYSMRFSRNTNTLTLTKDTGISTIYYKVNGANSYSSITSSTTTSVKYGCSAACYGAPSNGYTMETYPSSNPWSTTSMTSNQTCAPTATANTYSVTYNKGISTAGSVTIDGTTTQYANLPKVQNRTYPNASTLGTNNLTKSNTDIVTYTVTLSGHGGTPATASKTTTRYTGYTANGWTTTSGSTTRDYANGTSFGANSTTNLVLYPCFTQTATTPSITLPGATREGYTFMGWSTASNDTGVEYASGASYTPTGNTTLYAVWKKTITITFNVNGNGGSNSTKTCEMWNNDTSCSISKPTITCATNTPNIIGWGNSTSSHANDWGSSTSKNVSENTTYYAQCKSDQWTYGMSFNANNNTIDTTSKSCTTTLTYNGTAPTQSCNITCPTITAPSATPTVIGFSSAAATHTNGICNSNGSLTLNSTNSGNTAYAQTKKAAVTRTATYTKDNTSVSSITNGSTSCNIDETYNGTTQATSCNITLGGITCKTASGYSTPKWNTSYNPSAIISISSNSTFNATCSDTTAPTPTLSSTATLKATNQTATLKCNDGVGITAYYWGTTNPTAASSIATTTAADLTALASSAGLSKTISSAGTYYLGCKDAAGNFDIKSIVIRSYTVVNLLETVNGITNTYTNGNYVAASTGTYIIPNNTSMTLANIYTAPTGSNASNFKGYSTTYSSTAATPSTTAPTINANTTYYMWFNRLTYALTLNKGTGISSTNGAGTYKYGKTVNIDATVSNGYTWVNWTKTAGNDPTSATTKSTTVKITSATTLQANASDQTAPVCTVTTQPSKSPISTVAGYNTGTVTFTCTDAVGISTTSLTSGAVTLSNSYVTLSNATIGGTSTAKTFTFTYTAKSNVNGNVTFTLAAGKVSDAAGNTNNASSASNAVVVDTTKPTVTLSSNAAACKTGGTTYTITGTFSETVSGVETGDLTLTNASVVSFTKVNNTVYRWTVKASTTGTGTAKASIAASKATDGAGNNNSASNEISWTYDNVGPTFTFNNNTVNECSAGSLSITSANDVGCAGLASSAYKFGNGSWGTTTTYPFSTTTTQPGTGTITAYVRDALGNQTSHSATWTVNNVTPTANNFSTGNIGKTAKSITLAQFISASNASEGSCGTSALNFSGVKTNGTKGSCSISSNTLTYTPNTNKTGSDTCVITIKDNENSTKDITVTFNDIDTVAPTCSITEAACTSGALRLTLTANETINTPSGWTKTNGTTYYKDVTANTQITANISDTAGNVGNCSITPTHYDVNGPTFTFANKTVNECTAGSLSITNVVQVGCATAHASPYSFDNNSWNNTTSWTFSTSTSQPGSGNKTAYVRDALGNTTSHTATWTISNVAPTANNFTLNSNVGNAAKTGNWKTLSSATEGDCGNGDLTANVKTNGNKGSCSINGDVITYTPSANKTGSDSCIITIKDNENSTKDITVSVDGVDTVAPTCSISQSPAAGTWTSGNVTLTATVTDTNKDKYSWTGFSNMVTSLTTWTMTANGSKTMYVQDKAGNTGSCNITVNNIDKTKPTVSANNNGTSWKSGDIVITLSAGDTGGAGLEYSKYSWTSASDCTSAGTSFSNGGTITDSTEGNRTLYLCVKDKAGNTATWSGTYKLDKTAPVCGSWSYSPTTWTNGNVTATLAGSTDALAGIATAGGTCSLSSNTATCNVTIKDNAGNSKSCTSSTVNNIDKTAPTITFDKDSGTVAKSHNVVIKASDTGVSGLSGSQSVKYRWQTSSTCSTTAGDYSSAALTPTTAGSTSGTVTVNTNGLADGSYYLCVLANSVSDRAGNKNAATKTSGVFVIDNTKPTCSISQSPVSGTWTSGNVTLTATVTDTNKDKYSWTGFSNMVTSLTTWTMTANGNKTMYVQDKAGNTGTCNITVSNIDKTAPTKPTFTLPYTSGGGNHTNGNWTNKKFKSNITTTEANTVVTIQRKKGEGSRTTLAGATNSLTHNGSTRTTSEIWTDTDGRNDTIYFRAVDQAGNISEVSDPMYVRYDKTTPSIDMTNSSTSWKTGDISIKLTSSDATSGLSGSAKYYWTGNSSATLAQCRSNGTSYTSGSSITDSTEGTRYLYICAYDNAGNSSVKSGTYKLDKTNPTFTLTSPTNLYECTTGTATISSANDTGAGLASSPYSWNGGSYESSTSYKLYKATTGSQNIAVKVKDALGHETTKTATYTWLDSKPTANNFTITGTVTGTTINRKTKSNAQEGSCGNGNLTANITNSSNGTCTINGNNLTFKTNTGILTGNGTCTLRIKDDDNSTKDITVTFENIYNPNPSISFTGDTPNDNSTLVNQNRFNTTMAISGLDKIESLKYNFNGTEYDLMSGLILMYNFDNISSLGESSTVVKDLSNNGNDGVINGATWTSNGKHGGAYSFDGDDDYISLPSVPFTNNSTISMRVDLSNISAAKYFIGTNNSSYGFRYNGDSFLLYLGSSYTTVSWTKTSGFVHLVLTRNGGNYYIYINGNFIGSGTAGSSANTVLNYIGKRGNGYNSKIQIDEVRVYNRALSQDEIQFLYKSNLSKIDPSHWTLSTINTCLNSGSNNISGYVSSTIGTNTGTTRKVNTNISTTQVDGTGYNFGSHQVSSGSQILSGTMGTLTVTDYLGKSGWIVYFTTSPNLVGKSTNQSISTNNLKFKANNSNLAYSGLYDGYSNTHVKLGNGISASTFNTAHGSASTDNVLEYIVRTDDVNDFMCGDVGTYSDNTKIQLEIPAWQIQDEYEGTLWITLQQN